MCGRYALYSDIEQIKSHFPIDHVACEYSPNYNVAPTQEVLAVIRQEGGNILDKLHWGLVPFWAKDTKIGSKMRGGKVNNMARLVEILGGCDVYMNGHTHTYNSFPSLIYFLDKKRRAAD